MWGGGESRKRPADEHPTLRLAGTRHPSAAVVDPVAVRMTHRVRRRPFLVSAVGRRPGVCSQTRHPEESDGRFGPRHARGKGERGSARVPAQPRSLARNVLVWRSPPNLFLFQLVVDGGEPPHYGRACSPWRRWLERKYRVLTTTAAAQTHYYDFPKITKRTENVRHVNNNNNRRYTV